MKLKKRFLITILVLMCIFSAYTYVYNRNSITNIPKGNLILETKSPNKNYDIKMYLVNGGATVDFAIRGEVINRLGLKKNIYWAYHESSADVEWLNNEIVIINDKKINFKNESYDWRKNSSNYTGGE